MAFDFSALEGAVKLVTDAVNDTTTAFGGDSDAWTEFGNLVPDLLSLAPKIGDLPRDFKKLNVDEVAKLVGIVGSGIKVESEGAKSVVDGVVTLLHDVLSKVDDVVALSKSIKGLRDGDKPAEGPKAEDAPAEDAAPPSNGLKPVSE